MCLLLEFSVSANAELFTCGVSLGSNPARRLAPKSLAHVPHHVPLKNIASLGLLEVAVIFFFEGAEVFLAALVNLLLARLQDGREQLRPVLIDRVCNR